MVKVRREAFGLLPKPSYLLLKQHGLSGWRSSQHDRLHFIQHGAQMPYGHLRLLIEGRVGHGQGFQVVNGPWQM